MVRTQGLLGGPFLSSDILASIKHMDARVPSASKCTHIPLPSLSEGLGPSEKGRLQDGSALDLMDIELQTHARGISPHVLTTTHVPIKESGETQGAQRTEHSEDIPGD